MLNEKELSIESLILCLASFKPILDLDQQDPPVIDRSDYNLINSFAKQITRKIGFTDRQYDLAKRKVDDYADYFSFIQDLESIKNKTSLPIREIDRSRWIKLVDADTDNAKIAVRFTFQKKLISSIENIKRIASNDASYDPENKVHYFNYHERTLFTIIEELKSKNFEVDNLCQEIYNKILDLKEEEHVPGVYNLEVKNISNLGLEMIEKELGTPNIDSLYLFKDRAIKYGLINFDEDQVAKSCSSIDVLTSKIVNRKNHMIKIISSKFNLDQMISSLNELNRFPILFVLAGDKYFDYLVELNSRLINLRNREEISVVFRMENEGTGKEFNEYIKQEMINNKLDSNTKIVYTLDNKLPKPLLNSGWTPEAIVVLGDNKSIPHVRKVLDCYQQDLIIFYEETDGASTKWFFDKNLDIM